MKEFVLFDLGNTLVRYYDLPDYPPILRAAIGEVASFLGAETDWVRVAAEDFEAKDFQVRPLGERLRRIFPDVAWSEEVELEACRHFMKPIFTLANVYDDVLPTLAALRAQGTKTAIVSNTPWGSPAVLWREEMARLGLAGPWTRRFSARTAAGASPPGLSSTSRFKSWGRRQANAYSLETTRAGTLPGQRRWIWMRH